MIRNVILNIGDTIKYSGDSTGIIENIRVISTGNYIEQYEYNGNDENIVLTLKNEYGVTSLWLKDMVVSKVL